MSYDFTELEKVMASWNNVRKTPTLIICSEEKSGWKVTIKPKFKSLMYNDTDIRVYCASQQLKGWGDCVQAQNFNSWLFKTKKDAEKFLILFNLKWGDNVLSM